MSQQTHTIAPTAGHTMMVTNRAMQTVKRMAIPIVATKPVLTAPMSTVAKLQMTMRKGMKKAMRMVTMTTPSPMTNSIPALKRSRL
jgi:hypothetical protein